MNVTEMIPSYFSDVLNSGDPVMMEYTFVKHSILPLGIASSYLLTVLIFGPMMMKNREPFDLRRYALWYDIFTAIANGILSYKVASFILTHGLHVLCKEPTCPPEYKLRDYVADLCYEIYATKFLEMLDTVFFVLQKKFEHISNLHIFHHSTVPLMVWISMRSQRRMHLVVYGFVNCGVHVIMYTYYGLSVLGPRFHFIRRYKKYLTLMQIMQFVAMVTYFTGAIVTGCATAKTAVVLFIIHTTVLIYMFTDFYIKNFVRPKATPAPSKPISEEKLQNGFALEKKNE